MPKTLTIRYFAAFRESVGTSQETIKTDAIRTQDVFVSSKDRHGFDRPVGTSKVALNDDLVAWDTQVSDGDTVALFPLVAGG